MLAAGSVAAAALTTLASLAATVIILRFLAPDDAGRFALCVELLYVIGILGSLGQPVLQARIYHQAGEERFDWPADLRGNVALTLPVVVLLVGGAFITYRLSAFEIGFLIVGAELFVLTNCLSAVLAQRRRYAWSSALLRLPNALLLLPALVMLVPGAAIPAPWLLISLVVCLALCVVFGGIQLARVYPRGARRITRGERTAGLIFLVSLLALVVPQRGLIVVTGAILSAEVVAALAAWLSLLRVFDLVGETAGRVFATEAALHPRHFRRELFLLPWLLAAVISIALLLVLPPMARAFYAGRYDSIVPLLPWLIAAGAFRFVEIVPRTTLAYLAPQKLLKQFAFVQCAVAVIGVLAMLKLTADHGIAGAAWSATGIAVARLFLSYLFLARSSTPEPREGLDVEALESGGEESPV